LTNSTAHRRPKLLAVAFGVVAALAAAEVLVRVVGAPEVAPIRRGRFQLSANPRLVFEPVPGLAHEAAGGPERFFEYQGRSNSLGYRDREHPVEKPPGTYRIVVLGDSIAAGYRIARGEETFPVLLEERLRRAGLPAEVLNFGVSGYNTEQEVETLRTRALRFAPDLVVVAYCHNDRRPPDPRIVAALREARGGRTVFPVADAQRVLIRSALYRFVRYGVLAPRESEGGAAGGNTVARSLRELALLSRREGFGVLLAVFPYLPKPYDADHAREHVRLARLAREVGFHHLDLRPAFRDCRGRPEKLRFDRYHPTAAGHRCAAEAIAAAILRAAGPARLRR
jgi:lysophospholipase L1-like esterase